ncbi:MAG: hypothetical protein ACRD1V_01950 [Vicinamibacterales bacterium]
MRRRGWYLLGGAIAIGVSVLLLTPRRPETTILDLAASSALARRQPSEKSFHVGDITLGGETKRSIETDGSTRLTVHVTVPSHARFQVALGLVPEVRTQPAGGVLFLIGISDGHAYQTLRSVTIMPYGQPSERRWQDANVSLEEYAGLTVDLVLNTRPASGPSAAPIHGVWGRPLVLASQ